MTETIDHKPGTELNFNFPFMNSMTYGTLIKMLTTIESIGQTPLRIVMPFGSHNTVKSWPVEVEDIPYTISFAQPNVDPKSQGSAVVVIVATVDDESDEYDSRVDTRAHIARVRELVENVAFDLSERAAVHDRSKLFTPEVEVFDVVSPKLKELTYGSDEYKASLDEMGAALTHHYDQNDHHAEHFEEGIWDMNLVQLTEMLCDWKAASERHDDGDIRVSIEKNTDRFGYDELLKMILLNTVDYLGW
jgi:hypothetical protein